MTTMIEKRTFMTRADARIKARQGFKHITLDLVDDYLADGIMDNERLRWLQGRLDTFRQAIVEAEETGDTPGKIAAYNALVAFVMASEYSMEYSQ